MANVDPKIARTITWIAGIVAIVVAAALPAMYFALSYRSIVAGLTTEAEINARIASAVINENPEMWRFQQPKLEESLSRRPRHGHLEVRRILDNDSKVIAESVDALEAPLITETADLRDTGLTVGRIEISQSLRSLLTKTGVVVLLGLLLGCTAFFSLRVLPLRALGHALADNVQLYEEASQNLNRIRALHEIDLAITSTLDLHGTLYVLLEKIDLVLPYAATTVRLFNPENGLLEPVACKNLDEKEWKTEAWRGGRGLANVAFESNAPTVIRNAQIDPRVRDPEFYRKHKLISYLAIPLIAKEKTLGVIGFYTKQEHDFSNDEVEFLKTLAGQAAIAIHNARLHEETERRRREAEELARVAQSLTTTLDTSAVGERIVASVREMFGARMSMLRLLQPDGTLRVLASSSDGFSQDSGLAALPAGTGLVSRAVTEERAIRSADVLSDPGIQLTEQMRDYLVRSGNRSMVTVPLRAHERIIGSLAFLDQAGRVYSDGEVALLRRVADQAALALENARLFEETQQRNRELQALYTVSKRISRSFDIGPLLQAALVTTIEVLKVDAGRLYVFDEKINVLRLAAHWGVSEDQLAGVGDYAPGEGVIGKIFVENRPFVFADVETDPNYQALARGKLAQRGGYRSVVGLPISIKDRPVGVIYLYGKAVREFTPQDIELLSAIGSQIGVAVENARLFEETQQNLGRIRALHEIDLAITSTLDRGTILDVLLEKTERLLPHIAATTVRLLNKETGELAPIACRNLPKEEWKVATAQATNQDLRRLLPNDDDIAIAIPNVQTETDALAPDFLRKYGLVSGLRVPLTAKNEVLGVITFFTSEPHEFGREEIEFLSALAGQGAIAIENAQLYEEITKRANELQRKTWDLEKANHVKDEFLGVISHELRTPLNVIMGYSGLLADGMFGELSPEQNNTLHTVITQSQDLLSIVNQILQVTQIETGEIPVIRTAVNLIGFLDELKMAYDIPKKKELTIDWDYPLDLPSVKTDSGKLKEILQNLLNNAIKFTEDGTISITARYRPEAKAVVFKVADTGTGIAKESLPIIFEKFRQVDGSNTRAHGGVGLGLYIVKKYTELIDGEVEVKSDLGKGSTFTVTIPCEAAAQRPSWQYDQFEQAL